MLFMSPSSLVGVGCAEADEVDGAGNVGDVDGWERRLWLPPGKQQQTHSLLPTTIASAVLPIALAFALVGAVP